MQNRNINRSTNLMQVQYTSQTNNIVVADLFIIVKFTHSTDEWFYYCWNLDECLTVNRHLSFIRKRIKTDVLSYWFLLLLLAILLVYFFFFFFVISIWLSAQFTFFSIKIELKFKLTAVNPNMVRSIWIEDKCSYVMAF